MLVVLVDLKLKGIGQPTTATAQRHIARSVGYTHQLTARSVNILCITTSNNISRQGKSGVERDEARAGFILVQSGRDGDSSSISECMQSRLSFSVLLATRRDLANCP